MNEHLPLISKDWGEANRNPMVRAYGKKKGPRAKCKSCQHCIYLKEEEHYSCVFRYPIEHETNFIACSKYKNKNERN